MLSTIAQLKKFAVATPESVAIVDVNCSIRYGDLWKQVNAVANACRNCNSVKGARVAVIASKRINTVCVILGAMRAGLVPVPINPLLKSHQVQHILDDCNATLLFLPREAIFSLRQPIALSESLTHLICTDTISKCINDEQYYLSAGQSDSGVDNTSLLSDPASVLNWSEFLQLNNNESNQCCDASATAMVLYTSGSTGNPKGVVLTHNNLSYGADSVSQYLNNTSNDRILALMPLSFDYGFSQLTTAFHVGACAVLHDYFLPKGIIHAVVEHKITGLPAVPHVWDQLANLEWPEVPHLRYLTNTGGRMTEATSRKLASKLPNVELYLMYGFTEAFRSTYLPPAQLTHRPRSIGKAVPHAEVLIVDDTGAEVPPETVGELIHSGPLVTAGYWNDPELTRMKFRPRYSNTAHGDNSLFAWSGDLCTRDANGFIYFVSRRDDQVKLRGFRVNPLEIEEAIASCPEVLEVCVVCKMQGERECVAIAFFVGKAPCVEADVITHCKTHLPSFMIPHSIIQLDHLAASPNNKIDKRQLLKTYEKHVESENSGSTNRQDNP